MKSKKRPRAKDEKKDGKDPAEQIVELETSVVSAEEISVGEKKAEGRPAKVKTVAELERAKRKKAAQKRRKLQAVAD